MSLVVCWLFCCMIHVLLHVLKHVDTFVVFSRHKVAVVNMFPPYAMKSNQQSESHADYRRDQSYCTQAGSHFSSRVINFVTVESILKYVSQHLFHNQDFNRFFQIITDDSLPEE